MIRALVILGLLAATVAIPFLLRPEDARTTNPDRVLVIVSPHNEAIRHEFARAFTDHWRDRTGEEILVDWRTPGGTSEIARFLASEFLAAFQHHWTATLKRPWNARVEGAFDNHRVNLPDDPAGDTLEQSARRAFIESNVGCGIDLFFGGGAYDFIQQARAGRLVDSGVLVRHPAWFKGPNAIPAELGGERFYDPKGRWIGVCLSAFGIVSNRDGLQRLGIESIPDQWHDLADPRLFGEVALADPTKSGSVAKAFEMLIQQLIQQAVTEHGGIDSLDEDARHRAVATGWDRAMRLILQIAANARYFTDSATKIPIDVALGDASAGMCIDFYGRFQSEALRRDADSNRLTYITPRGGSSVGVDPIGLLRGAPEPALARAFIDFTLSIEGQKLWNFETGTPGGPRSYALRRLPIRRELYQPQFTEFRSDPTVNAYDEATHFTYHPEWTAPLFSVIRFVIRAMCLDPHDELRHAWLACLENNQPQNAIDHLLDVSAVDYDSCLNTIRPVLSSPDRVDEVRLAEALGRHFRNQFREAARLAARHDPAIDGQ